MKKERKRQPYDERCGDCYYNEKGMCKVDPKKCIYLKPKKEEKDG